MKRVVTTLCLLALGAAGYVGVERPDLIEQALPKEEVQSTVVRIRGPSEGLFGRDYYFFVDTNSDKVKWQVYPEVDLHVTDNGRLCRIRAPDVGEYVITVAADGRGDVDQDGIVFIAVDPTPEVVQLEGPTFAEQLSRRPPPGLWVTGRRELLRIARELKAGLHAPDEDPVQLARDVLGDEWAPFLDDLSRIVDRLGPATAVSAAPIIEEAANVLGGE